MRECGWPGYPLLPGVLTYTIFHDSLMFFVSNGNDSRFSSSVLCMIWFSLFVNGWVCCGSSLKPSWKGDFDEGMWLAWLSPLVRGADLYNFS